MEKYATGCKQSSFPTCDKTPSTAWLLASTSTINGFPNLGKLKTGFDDSFCFRTENAVSQESSHWNGTFSLVSLFNGWQISAKF